MASSELTLLGFAEKFSHGLQIHYQVDEQDLADALRAATGLPRFPSEAALRQACRRLGVEVKFMPDNATTLLAANAWRAGRAPEIYLSKRLRGAALPRKLCHELRELIETGLKWTNHEYAGLDTRDNVEMNPVSERFANSLLMPASAMRLYLRELDYDPVWIAGAIGQPLPAVLVRMAELLQRPGAAPRAGYWLYQAPWPLSLRGLSRLADLRAEYWAITGGFPMRLGGPLESYMQNALLPVRGRPLSDIGPLASALVSGRACRQDTEGFAAIPKYDVTLIAEPLSFNGAPWRVLVCAVLKPDLYKLEGWLERMNPRWTRVVNRSNVRARSSARVGVPI